MLYLLRQTPVKTLKHLPKFLPKDNDFENTALICDDEHEKLRLTILDVKDQFFVETATWGLDSWEKILDITANYKLDYGTRRAKILSKINSNAIVSREFLTNLINLFTADKSGKIIEHNNEYWFEVCVNIDGIISDGDINIRDAVEVFKPAHLGFKMVFYIINDIPIDHEADIIQYINSEHNFWNIKGGIAPHWDGKFIWDGEIDWSGHTGEDYKERQTFCS